MARMRSRAPEPESSSRKKWRKKFHRLRRGGSQQNLAAAGIAGEDGEGGEAEAEEAHTGLRLTI